jgi:hypothetical protein
LPTGHPGKSLETLLAVAGRELSDDGEQIDTVQSESRDIEAMGAAGGNGQGNPHARGC